MQALRAGVSVVEFWALTPRETLATLEATVWRAEQRAAGDLSHAWHIAALTRIKRMPTLKRLLMPFMPSKAKLQPIEERRREFLEMRAKVVPQLMRAANNFRSAKPE